VRGGVLFYMGMSKCRRCKKEVDKHKTLFGYCMDCVEYLGGREVQPVAPSTRGTDARVNE